MAYLQGKTPISYLQELCTKRMLTPQYDLVANEGAVHEPTFVFRVTAGEFVGTGKGPSKKKAKHNASLAVLNSMMGVANGNTSVVEEYSAVAAQNAKDGGDAGNPVGELQEFTQKKLLPPPIYDYTSEQGPPHSREFVCNIKLWTFTQRSVGKSKKIAKRNAAAAMLQALKSGAPLPSADGDHEEYDEENISLDGKKIPTINSQNSQAITQFYQKLKNTPGKHLGMLHNKKLAGAPSTNFCQMLQEIAEEHRFEVTYVDVPELSVSGQHQCLVQVSTMPVAVCHGTGQSRDEARAQAAHHALQYLKIMTKKA